VRQIFAECIQECSKDGINFCEEFLFDILWVCYSDRKFNNALNAIKVLLKFGVDVNYTDDNNTNCLLAAVNTTSPDIVELLLQQGADPNVVIIDERHSILDTAFIESSFYNCCGSGYGDKWDKSGYTGLNKIIKLLKKYGAKHAEDLFPYDDKKQLDILDCLLLKEVQKTKPDEKKIRSIITCGGDINAYDNESNAILTFLESVNDRFNWYDDEYNEDSNIFPDDHDYNILKTLLELGADPNSIMHFNDRTTCDTDYTCLYEVAITCSYRLVELLVLYGAKAKDYLLFDIFHWAFYIAEEFEIDGVFCGRPNKHKLRNGHEMLKILNLFVEKGELSKDTIQLTCEKIQYLNNQIIKLQNHIAIK
jgi:regulator of RNase E activity RraB